MKKAIKEMYDAVTPLWSDDELINNTLRKAETMENRTSKKRFGKPFAAICAAAVMAAAGTITVGAVYKWDLSGFFGKAQYKDDSLASSDAVIANMDKVDFSRFGKPLDDVIEFEGGRVKMEAVLFDMMNVEFLYNVEFDEPEKFDGYNTEMNVEISKVDKESGESEGCRFSWTNGTDIIDGVTYEYMSAGFPQDNVNDRCLRFNLKELKAHKTYYDDELQNFVDDYISLPIIGSSDILIDIDTAYYERMIRTAHGTYEVTSYEKTLVIDSVRLSPLALNFTTPAGVESDTFFDIMHEMFTIGSPAELRTFFKVRMSDGTVLDINNGSAGSTLRDDGSTVYDIPILPVDTANAVAVIIGDVEIPLE